MGRYFHEVIFQTSHRKRIEFDNFFADISSCTRLCPCVKKPEGTLKIKQTNNRWLKLVEVFSEILAELLLIRDIFIHVEIADGIEVNM